MPIHWRNFALNFSSEFITKVIAVSNILKFPTMPGHYKFREADQQVHVIKSIHFCILSNVSENYM